MGGIRTGTRLDQVRALHRQVIHEITAARRDLGSPAADRLPRLLALRDRLDAELDALTGRAPRRPSPTPRAPRRPDAAMDRDVARLRDLGITTRQVKEWAVAEGLLPAVRQGRVSIDLINAYAAAHPDLADTTTGAPA